MSDRHGLLQLCKATCLVLTLGVSMSAYGFDGASWKEEVQLHDGSKVIVNRSHTYGGYGEIGQGKLLAISDIKFTIPGTSKAVTWKTDFGRGNEDNLNLLLLDVLNGVPYIATKAAFCHAYNKWERPNPPYIFFKYEDDDWKRIALEEFPAAFKEVNVVVSTKTDEKKLLSQSLVSAELIKQLNSSLKQKEYKTILRTPIDLQGRCPESTGPDGLPIKEGSKAQFPMAPPNNTTEGKK